MFLAIHVLGVTCFAFIVARRLVPLLRAERDFRFDRPLARLRKVCKFWLGQWKHPRYKAAGTLHIFIFSGFILLATRAFTVLIVGVSENFVMPGLSGKPATSTTSSRTTPPRLCSCAWLLPWFAGWCSSPRDMRCQRDYGKGHTADAVFLLVLIALLMVADSLFAAAKAAGQSQRGLPANFWPCCHCLGSYRLFSLQLPYPLLSMSTSEPISSMK